jgi:hypothetical protein
MGPLSALQLTANAELPNGRITGTVRTDLTQRVPQYQGHLDFAQLAIDKVFGVSTISGIFQANAAFMVSARTAVHVTGKLQGSDLSVYGRPLGDLQLSGDLKDRELSFVADTQGLVGALHCAGQVRMGPQPTYDINLQTAGLDVARVAEKTTVLPTGITPLRLNLDAWVKGSGMTLAEAETAVNVTLSESQVGDSTAVRGHMRSTLRRGTLQVEGLSLTAPETTVSARGQLSDILHTPRGTVTYRVATKDVAPWSALMRLPITGGATLTGTARGSLHALSVEGKTTLSAFRVATASLQSGTITYAATNLGSRQPTGDLTATLNGVEQRFRFPKVQTHTDSGSWYGPRPHASHASYESRGSLQHGA